MRAHLGWGLVVSLWVLGGLRAGETESRPASSASTEEGWIVRAVAVDFVRLAAFARGTDLPAPDAVQVEALGSTDGVGRYRVTFPGAPSGGVELALRDHALDARAYQPLGVALTSGADVRPDAADYTPVAAAGLRAFTLEAFQTANRTISEFLTAHPRSPAAHEDAAVLLGAFALRDNAGLFWNPLRACARATAHLALAAALRGDSPAGADAQLADLAIGLIIDTKATCARQIEELAKCSASRPELEPWLAAARYRNTRDWRPEAAADAPLLVKVERFRALVDAADTAPAVTYLESLNPPDVVDWSRMIVQVPFSVGDGHRFAMRNLRGEIDEAAKIIEHPFPQSPSEWAALVEALNVPPGASVTGTGAEARVNVIDEGLWMDNAQRHLCQSLEAMWGFLADQWGVPEEAASFWQDATTRFGGLRLFPVVGLLRADTPAELKPYAAGLQQLMRDHPEWVPDVAWFRAGASRFRALLPDVRAQATAWFQPPIIPGTAYRFGSRRGQMTHYMRPDAQEVERVWRLAPTQSAAVRAVLEARIVAGASEADLRAVAGPLLDYSLSVVRLLGRAGNLSPAFREELLERAARISPDEADELARFYVQRREPEKAAKAYQAYIDDARDRVAVSNRCDWLVNYYETHGQPGKALEVAKMAAEVYSYAGLQTYATLLEKRSDLTGAEETFRKIAERYDDEGVLYRFLQRHGFRADLAAKAREISERYFPKGMRKVTVADFSGAPRNGVAVRSENELSTRNGVRSGDVIVAFDGVQVESFPQYQFVRAISDDPRFRLIIYRDGTYREIAAEAPRRRFGVDMATFE